jgi:hypothetical protein
MQKLAYTAEMLAWKPNVIESNNVLMPDAAIHYPSCPINI